MPKFPFTHILLAVLLLTLQCCKSHGSSDVGENRNIVVHSTNVDPKNYIIGKWEGRMSGIDDTYTVYYTFDFRPDGKVVETSDFPYVEGQRDTRQYVVDYELVGDDLLRIQGFADSNIKRIDKNKMHFYQIPPPRADQEAIEAIYACNFVRVSQ